MQINENKLNEFLGRMINEMGAAANGSLIVLGDRLGLYKALANEGPMTSSDLAQSTGTTERYVREWLSAQAASAFVEYDATTETFHMTPEQIMVFANEDSPVIMSIN